MFSCTIYASNLIQAIINPICNFIFRHIIGIDICTNQILLFVGTSTGNGQYMVDIPTAIYRPSPTNNAVICISISVVTRISIDVDSISELQFFHRRRFEPGCSLGFLVDPAYKLIQINIPYNSNYIYHTMKSQLFQ